MTTTVSTTSLTAAETQLLNECNAHGLCNSLATEITRLQTRLALLQTRKTTADMAFQVVMGTVLSSKNPPVTVPSGATIVRQTVSGTDSLLVQTNP